MKKEIMLIAVLLLSGISMAESISYCSSNNTMKTIYSYKTCIDNECITNTYETEKLCNLGCNNQTIECRNRSPEDFIIMIIVFISIASIIYLITRR